MGIVFWGLVMLAASPARIMRRPPAAFHKSGAGARPTVVDSMILAGEAASIPTPKKEYPYPILTPFGNSEKEGQDQVLVLFLGYWFITPPYRTIWTTDRKLTFDQHVSFHNPHLQQSPAAYMGGRPAMPAWKHHTELWIWADSEIRMDDKKQLFLQISWNHCIFEWKFVKGCFKSLDLGIAVILVFVLFWKHPLFVPKLAGMLYFLNFQYVFVKMGVKSYPFEELMVHLASWTPSKFGRYPKCVRNDRRRVVPWPILFGKVVV